MRSQPRALDRLELLGDPKEHMPHTKKWYCLFENEAGHHTTIFITNDHPMTAINLAIVEYRDHNRYTLHKATRHLIKFGVR